MDKPDAALQCCAMADLERVPQDPPRNGEDFTNPALTTPGANIHLTSHILSAPDDYILRPDHYRLDLSVTPRPANARACYRDRWGLHHFERLGDMFLVPPGQTLHIRSDGTGTQSSIICELQADMIVRGLGEDIAWTDQRLHATLDISSNTIRHLLRRLAEEARNPGSGSRHLVEHVVGQLAIELGRYCEAVTDLPASGGLAAWRLRRIDERLAEDRDAPTLAELATFCNISVRQLTRGFLASRGCTIGDYIGQNRIETAKRLLRSDRSIKAIAQAIGFSSSSSFAWAFRRATGLTPRQFRDRVLQTAR